MKAFALIPAIALALTLSVSSTQAATDVYVVSGIQDGQFLNMRSNAGTNSAITGKIPSNAQGIVTTGEQRKINNAIWAKVYWKGIGGWVNKSYLSSKPQTTVTPRAKPATSVMAPYRVTAPPMMPPVKVPSYMIPPKPLSHQ